MIVDALEWIHVYSGWEINFFITAIGYMFLLVPSYFDFVLLNLKPFPQSLAIKGICFNNMIHVWFWFQHMHQRHITGYKLWNIAVGTLKVHSQLSHLLNYRATILQWTLHVLVCVGGGGSICMQDTVLFDVFLFSTNEEIYNRTILVMLFILFPGNEWLYVNPRVLIWLVCMR